jgi:hypothetical protein
VEASHGAAGALTVEVVREREVTVGEVVLEDLTVEEPLEQEKTRVSGGTASRQARRPREEEVRDT